MIEALLPTVVGLVVGGVVGIAGMWVGAWLMRTRPPNIYIVVEKDETDDRGI
jgi:hypothetical protein